MSFDPINNPIDYILLSNRRSPGLAVVRGASSPRFWDKRRGFALSGARVFFRGVDLAEFFVTLRLLSEEDFEAWHAWRDLLKRPEPGVRQTALDIWHPILEDLEIVSAVVLDFTQPTQVADGEWNLDIKFMEYRRPVRINSEAEFSEEAPVPQTEGERQIASAQEEGDRLRAQLDAAGG